MSKELSSGFTLHMLGDFSDMVPLLMLHLSPSIGVQFCTESTVQVL